MKFIQWKPEQHWNQFGIFDYQKWGNLAKLSPKRHGLKCVKYILNINSNKQKFKKKNHPIDFYAYHSLSEF